MPHKDGPGYCPQAVILSLGAPAMIHFWRSLADSKKSDGACVSVYLRPRSLLIFTGSLYTDCFHGIEVNVASLFRLASFLLCLLRLRSSRSVQRLAQETNVDVIGRSCANAAAAGVEIGDQLDRTVRRAAAAPLASNSPAPSASAFSSSSSSSSIQPRISLTIRRIMPVLASDPPPTMTPEAQATATGT
jgi:hypothetical protein